MAADNSGGVPNSFRTSEDFKMEEIGEDVGAEPQDPEETNVETIERTVLSWKLPTTEILRLAGVKFIESSSKQRSDLSMLSHSYSNSFVKLSADDSKDIQLLLNLLAAAEKVGGKQFERAGILLKKYNNLSLDKGNSVQRVVHYFSGALRERIDRETGRCCSKGSGKLLSLSVERTLSSTNSTIVAFQKAVPFSVAGHIPGVQAILEQVGEERKVHIIDLHIRTGTQYTMLMQALASQAERPIEHLKITAVGTTCKGPIEETGRRLKSFAESLNLPFSFSVVIVQDILDLTEEHFELGVDEAVAVYSEYILMLMLSHPDRLESLMRVIRAIDPRVMVVTEVEANSNSPIFANRFIEALFYYGAYYDAFGDCFQDDETSRVYLESMFFIRGIKNVVAAEGEERAIRHVKINVWRAFFKRFGMVEVGLSTTSLYQAKLMLNRFPCGNSCTLDMDGKCLIVGWKGIPTQSLSVWKFK